MRKLRFLYLLPVILFTVVTGCKKERVTPLAQSPYISRIFEYAPAPGQFINDKSYGTPAKAQDLIGGVDNGLLSLGGFGGYVVFGFDHPIKNITGADIGIFGNPLILPDAEWSEAGIVLVMKDTNGNGLPDDTWYELAGSDYNDAATIKNYTITYFKPANTADDIQWADNKGGSGSILRNTFHAQGYYPAWADGKTQFSFTGTLLKSTLQDGGIIANKPFASGYTDNGDATYIALQEQLGRGYNALDIANAVDASGHAVALDQIDFVKVYTAQNSNGNPYLVNDHPRSRYLGEISTEIGGAIDIALYNKIKKL